MTRLLRPALALFVLAAVAACDASAPVETAEAGFEAEVRGAFARSVAGPAVADSLGGVGVMAELGLNREGQTISAFRLGADDADDTFYLIGTTRGPLVPGAYPVERVGPDVGVTERGRDRFSVLYRYDGGRPEGGVALGMSGTLTITEVADGEVAGSFAFDAQILDRDMKTSPGEADLSVEGAFRAETRRRALRDDV